MKRHLPLLLCFACLGVQAQDFAFDFFRQVQTGSSKVVVSPISAEVALSMLAEGTEGEGGKQILDALGVSSSEELGNRYAGLLKAFPGMGENVVFESANSIWSNIGFDINDAYRQTIGDIYGADAFSTSLSSEEGIKEIDLWTSKKTHGIIPSLGLQPKPELRMALVNTIYLKGSFAYPFDEQCTRDERFTNANGDVVMVPTMTTSDVRYAHLEELGFDAVDLPLGVDGECTTCSLILFKPLREGATLSSEVVDAYFRNASFNVPVFLKMPRFAIHNQDYNLKEILPSLGITDIFSHADFSKIASGLEYVSEMKQKTDFSVDENGIEGAAATFIALSEGMPQEYKEVALNHPFQFAVAEEPDAIALSPASLQNRAFPKNAKVRVFSLTGKYLGEVHLKGVSASEALRSAGFAPGHYLLR